MGRDSRARLGPLHSGIIIQKFVLRDYEEVARLWRKCGFDSRPGDSLRDIQVKIRRDPDLFLVAKKGKKVIGTVIGAWDGRRGWIYHLAVAPEHRRLKLGSSLIEKVESGMRAKGVLKVNAMVLKTNKPSLKLFRNFGYARQDYMVVVGKLL